VHNPTNETTTFHWIRKAYQAVDGLDHPEAFFTNESALDPIPMPDTNGAWATTRFVDPSDLRHDFHVNIVTFQPGGLIPFAETHVMEHGLYVLEGKAVYRLNQDWVELRPGITCGCARFAHRLVMRVDRVNLSIFCTKM
jgi:(S)-ureidoglycine aminohydrolase